VYRVFETEQRSRIADQWFRAGENIYRSGERSILGHFQKEASSYLPTIPASDKFTWLQYAQHYGVPTRLLDFSANPLVALFFCCYIADEQDGALWAINTLHYQNWLHSDPFCLAKKEFSNIELIASALKSITDNGSESCKKAKLEISRPVIFIPEYIDNRMASQASRFLLWGSDNRALESMVSDENWMVLSDSGIAYGDFNDKRFLAKVVIPSNMKHTILAQLSTLGISERSIFPGVEGIGKYIERFHRNHPDDITLF